MLRDGIGIGEARAAVSVAADRAIIILRAGMSVGRMLCRQWMTRFRSKRIVWLHLATVGDLREWRSSANDLMKPVWTLL
ncbi:hypothetical protein CFB84_27925 [Burkholderia aenigmatica]|uniref:Uncharacterized protein n=1 Tax=Burkholderia aenigmatica TaxID=2015348 RepID=A0A228I8S9_9BURK|nr:hypothetical protein CFB84_27925 [Burkholderia aenigmatica]